MSNPEVVVEATIELSRSPNNVLEGEGSDDLGCFVPHAIVVAENRIPQPIFVAGYIGVKRLLLLEFDLGRGESSFPEQAKEGIAAKLREWGRDGVPATGLPSFGRPVGFIVNYHPDHAVRYDLTPTPLEHLASAYRVGSVELRIRNKIIGK